MLSNFQIVFSRVGGFKVEKTFSTLRGTYSSRIKVEKNWEESDGFKIVSGIKVDESDDNLDNIEE